MQQAQPVDAWDDVDICMIIHRYIIFLKFVYACTCMYENVLVHLISIDTHIDTCVERA